MVTLELMTSYAFTMRFEPSTCRLLVIRVPVTVTFPLSRDAPTTFKGASGAVVPIPTLPLANTFV